MPETSAAYANTQLELARINAARAAKLDLDFAERLKGDSPEALKAFKSPVPGQTRQEGIAIIDVDPSSANFGKILGGKGLFVCQSRCQATQRLRQNDP